MTTMQEKQISEKNCDEESKIVYEKPAIEVIEMETEGILCASAPTLPGEDW